MTTMTRPKMTTEQAQSFTHTSMVNATIVAHSLKCGCKPYEDVYTYRRWLAQGYQVQRGEHSIKIGLVRTVDSEDDNGDTIERKVFGSSHVFCRCQVNPINGNGKHPDPIQLEATVDLKIGTCHKCDAKNVAITSESYKGSNFTVCQDCATKIKSELDRIDAKPLLKTNYSWPHFDIPKFYKKRGNWFWEEWEFAHLTKYPNGIIPKQYIEVTVNGKTNRVDSKSKAGEVKAAMVA